ncbi:MAG TPA: 16S rRNA methyltransferase [Candidatus Thermoplasmatota archaeon]|jgi:rRNA small subunit pseudouridine methyltransferase Nep1|nr:16S rRNA methyltransferase [Candidatus Thermoplasmatota archaeon]
MLTLVLAEAEVEMMPAELYHHPAVIAHARQRKKQPSQILLDSNYDHAAMGHLPEGRRRGRPDITHLFLLTALESVVNKHGQLSLVIHTRNDLVINVDPKTRIMRNYERFLGLIEQLFQNHLVPESTQPLLSLQENLSLSQVIKQQQADQVIALSNDGTSVILPEYLKELKRQEKTHLLCIIGGFPSGPFHTDIKTLTTETISLYPEMLPAWTVASEILVNYGNIYR